MVTKEGGGSPSFPSYSYKAKHLYYKTHYIMGVVAEIQQGYVCIP